MVMIRKKRPSLRFALGVTFALCCTSLYVAWLSSDEFQSTEDASVSRIENDKFLLDHIDVPEITIKSDVINNSEYERRYHQRIEDMKQKSKSKIMWNMRELNSIDNKTKQASTLPAEKFSSSNLDEMINTSNDELMRFKQYFSQWPLGKPKAAFYILTSRNRFKSLKKTLDTIDQNFNNEFKYPIIIFHERDLTPMIDKIRGLTKSDLFFQLVLFRLPNFLTAPVIFNIPCLSPVSYRHMCRFNAKLVYEEPTIRMLDYYWRLDDDSLLLSRVKYDVFKYMRDNDIHYGYSWIFYDSEQCVTGLWESTSRYIKERKIKTKFFNRWPKPKLYYNNFEISNTKMWLSENYKDYIEYIDQLGGIYYHRWGDAPIHGIAVSLFLEKNQTHLFSDIGYKHNTYVHKADNNTVREL